MGERVDLRLCVGHPGEFEEQLRDPRRALRFESFAPEAKLGVPVPGLDGKSPAGMFKGKQSGLHLFVYESNRAFVELAPEKYAEYLRKEGLDDVLAERVRRGESALPGRDSYARFDKALVRVGAGATSGYERVVGLPLELVLESDPAAWQPGQALAWRLEFEGQPLPGRQVKLARLTAPHVVVLARTDEHGRVALVPESRAAFCAFAVHQRRATPEQGLEGDWDGFWASYSLDLASAPAALGQ